MKNIILYELVSGIILVGLTVWVGYGLFFESNIETPNYTLIDEKAHYELRQYPKFLIAEVPLSKTNDKDQNSGFRVLANYIFGNDIPMTAPVLTYKQQTLMAFVLPSDLKKSEAPSPSNKDVNIHYLELGNIAVLKFRGYVNDTIIAKKTNQLKTYLKEDGIKYKDNIYVSQYNSPFVFPLLRKNEVWVVLE